MLGRRPAHADVEGGQQVEVTPTRAVELEVPAEARYLRLARLVASGIGTDAGFDIGALEDLRVGVDEAASVLLATATGASFLRLRFRLEGDGVSIHGETDGGVGPTPPWLDMSNAILSGVTDEFAFDLDGTCRFRLVRGKQEGR
jgi:serine/threonine-protein kinase RsbW